MATRRVRITRSKRIRYPQVCDEHYEAVRAIQETLDDELPGSYTKDICARKVAAVFEHVFESYQGDGRSVFNQPVQ